MPCCVQSDAYESGLEVGNSVFAIIFNVEALLKLYALRKQYFRGESPIHARGQNI